MEGGNYVEPSATPSGQELPAALSNGEHPQIRNIAECSTPPLAVSSTTLIDTIVLYFYPQILLKSLC